MGGSRGGASTNHSGETWGRGGGILPPSAGMASGGSAPPEVPTSGGFTRRRWDGGSTWEGPGEAPLFCPRRPGGIGPRYTRSSTRRFRRRGGEKEILLQLAGMASRGKEVGCPGFVVVVEYVELRPEGRAAPAETRPPAARRPSGPCSWCLLPVGFLGPRTVDLEP